MIIAVDFDGTICTGNSWPNLENGEIQTDLVNRLIELKALGHEIILWTCREGEYLTQAVEYCRNNGLEFDYVNENSKEALEFLATDTRKIYADLYIDDKAETYCEFDKCEHDWTDLMDLLEGIILKDSICCNLQSGN